MEKHILLVFLPLLLVVTSEALSYQQQLGSPYSQIGSIGIGSCPRLQTRHQQIRQEVVEFCETVETQITTYDDVFTQSSRSGGFLCGVKAALEDLRSVLQSCRGSTILWINRIESLLQQCGGYCDVFTTRTVDVERVSTSIVTIKQQVREVRELVQTIDISSCDRRAESLLDQCSNRLTQLRSQWSLHQGQLGTLISPSIRGRDFDNNQVGRDQQNWNSFIVTLTDSYMKDSSISGFNKQESTETNYGLPHGGGSSGAY